MVVKKLMANFEKHGVTPRYFDTKEQAAEAICGELSGKSIAFGGSVTLRDMGIFEKLSENNEVYWHWKQKRPEQKQIECDTEVYILSANAVAETGEIVNIDGTGNRVANAIYGKQTVYYVFGTNKITPDLPSAIDRARQTASPPNAQRLGLDTPCTKDGLCHDCLSPQRICNVMTIQMHKPGGAGCVHAVIIGENLGY